MRHDTLFMRTATLVATLTAVDFAIAETLHVPADHTTIQSCIDAAVSGQDECVVAPGTYNETIDFLGKAITLRSSDGPEATIIDATGLNDSVITFKSGEGLDSVVEGFTITGGTGGHHPNTHHGGGIYISHASPTIIDNIITKNHLGEDTEGYNGGGIYLNHSNALITNNTIEKNVALGGGGIWMSFSAPTIEDNLILHNIADDSGGGIGISYSTGLISRNLIAGNRAGMLDGGAIGMGVSSPRLISNAIIGNTSGIFGGALLIAAASAPTIEGCTIVGNMSDYNFISIFQDSSANFANSIIVFNSSRKEIVSIDRPEFAHCDGHGNNVGQCFVCSAFPAGSGGNISNDPLFVRNPSDGGDGWGDDPATTDVDEGANDDFGDLRLQLGSPCIDAGDPDFEPLPGETDLGGRARVSCGRVDMGAYERVQNCRPRTDAVNRTPQSRHLESTSD